ncbi:GNAT family N-acetyltransferase [Oceaniglobus roseus]|uniref:GNAT family N-acetyltransferase n=1 Tax=Oceaniglobus roseus TaxID=1737570 RepID=UPI000C7F6FB3|nr:GNAT family N-acetyltransferase [Kandeliimicrobium roseum]
MTTLATDRFLLRKPQPSDLPAWTAFFRTPRATWIGGGPEQADRAWRAFAGILGHWDLRGYGFLTVESRDTGAPLGLIGPWCPEPWPEREIAWNLWDADREGTGVMAEAGRAVLAHVFGDLGWDTAVSYVDPANARSAALARRLGADEDPGAPRPGGEVGRDTLVFRHRPGAETAPTPRARKETTA